jgi:hypothetical protein
VGPLAQPVHEGDPGLDVGGAAWPKLTADRLARAVEDGPDDHLPEVRPMIFAVTVPPDRLAALAFEVPPVRVGKRTIGRTRGVAAVEIICGERTIWAG